MFQISAPLDLLFCAIVFFHLFYKTPESGGHNIYSFFTRPGPNVKWLYYTAFGKILSRRAYLVSPLYLIAGFYGNDLAYFCLLRKYRNSSRSSFSIRGVAQAGSLNHMIGYYSQVVVLRDVDQKTSILFFTSSSQILFMSSGTLCSGCITIFRPYWPKVFKNNEI